MKARATADHRLAVYGTLAPGGPNHGQLASLDGRWIDGQVRGHLFEVGWGAELGYPAIVLDGDADTAPVQVFEASDLPAHWHRLDEFEGPGYQRVIVTVETAEGNLPAWIYAMASG